VTFALDYVIDSSEIKILNDVIIDGMIVETSNSRTAWNADLSIYLSHDQRLITVFTDWRKGLNPFRLFVMGTHNRRKVAACGNKGRACRDATSVGVAEIPKILFFFYARRRIQGALISHARQVRSKPNLLQVLHERERLFRIFISASAAIDT